MALVAAVYAMSVILFVRDYGDASVSSTAHWSLQGRYIFTMMVPLALLIADGWGAMVGQWRWAPTATMLLLGALALFDVVSMGTLLQYYQWPPGRLAP